jgi:exopolysaccharide biosynthesis polyprenyl glycosylphosphotransferase
MAAPELVSVHHAPEPAPAAPRPTRLRRALVAFDVAAVIAGWLTATAVTGDPGTYLTVLVAGAATLLAMRSRRLYLARVCAIRSAEVLGIAWSATAGALAVYAAGRFLPDPISLTTALWGASATFVFVAIARGRFGRWLRSRRQAGDLTRPIVLVGYGDEAQELRDLIATHPETGLRVVGSVGHDTIAGLPWLGPVEHVTEAVEAAGAVGVLIAAAEIPSAALNPMVRTLTRAGIHVQLSNGLRGLDHRRVRTLPVAHEPLLYVEPASLSRGQHVAKRVLDLVGAVLLLIVTAPVLAVAAVAIKLDDRGPVFFRQTRVGLRGRTFTLYKLRTMVPDAEAQLVDVTQANERTNGPLFKLEHDPRRTRVGRILERASLDEIPQLLNVVRGEMSLVGPRPALPREVAEFEPELLGRHEVLPGITGLWQVEGRENPDFSVYRRLDLFYVENWSVGFDLVIIGATVHAILSRLVPRRKAETVTSSPTTLAVAASATTTPSTEATVEALRVT